MSRPVPIVLASQMIVGGGTERQLVELAKAIDKTRFTPHVVCMIDDPQTRASLEGQGIPVEVVPVRTFIGAGTVKLAFSFKQFLRRHQIKLFHAFDMPFAIFGAPVARWAGTPTVLTSCRGHRDLYEPKHQKMLRFSDRFANGIVCNATALAEDLASKGIPSHRIRICYNGIDLSRFPTIRKESTSKLTIGTVCVLRPEKNLQLLVRAFAALPDRGRVQLRITGSGPEREPLEALARSLGLNDSEVSFHPAVSNIAAELEGIDIFVLPSLSEGLSNSIMEAMACGCALAVSAVGGNLELVKDQETGLLFDPASADSLTAALKELTANNDLRARLASAGAGFLRDGFSMDASARKMESIYDEFLASAPKRT